MSKVVREEVRSRQEYEAVRDEFRAGVMAAKKDRRIHLGEYFTLLFENHDTVLYQIQEMIRAEGLASEPEIRHEIDTYNELIGDRGELGATLLIEIDDPGLRDRLLEKWKGVPESFYIETHDGRRVMARIDERQVGERRISSVHYLKFAVGDGVPARIGCEHPEVRAEIVLPPPVVAALGRDLVASARTIPS